MADDEKRIAIGLGLFAAAVAVIGPLTAPWNYALAAILLLAAGVVWFRPMLVGCLQSRGARDLLVLARERAVGTELARCTPEQIDLLKTIRVRGIPDGVQVAELDAMKSLLKRDSWSSSGYGGFKDELRETIERALDALPRSYADVAEPIRWDDHFGIEYSMQQNGTVCMRTYMLNGTNASTREVALQDAYFVSGKTGEKLPLVVTAGENDGFLRPDEINPIPPGATVTLRAEFNNPTGYTADEMLARWGPILFYAQYDGQQRQRIFSEADVAATFANFRPKQIGPRVTKKRA